MPDYIFDVLLCLTLVWIAWRVAVASVTYRAVILFVIFGLMQALAWVRLQAPDIALAEAAIGAGLTGALLLDAAGHFQRASARGNQPPARVPASGDD